MRIAAAAVLLAVLAGQSNVTPSTFQTKSRFRVGDRTLSLSTVVATLEPRAGAPGYFWLRIYFYAFAPTAQDIVAIRNGSVASLDRRWQQTASNPPEYNRSRAVMQLSVDQDHHPWQLDVSVPGRTCTVAASDDALRQVVQQFQFDGTQLILRSTASGSCPMTPNETMNWAVDLDLPVFSRVDVRR